MLEDQQPLLRLCPLVQVPPRFERDERLQVVAHDPREREMGGGRHDVGDEAGLLSAALDEDRLVIGNVSRRGETPNAGQDEGLAIDQLERHTLEVVRQIAARRTFVGVLSEVELALLHDIACLGKRETDIPRGIAPVVTTRVVEMEMRVDHPANVLRRMVQLAERVLQFGSAVSSRVIDAIDLDELAVFFVADPGIDQRSEEHTSELQSLAYLVCRLLLEKKKQPCD